jgi:SAM-dependent methyltransferase
MGLPDRCPLCQADRDAQHVVTRHVYGDTKGRAFFGCGTCSAIYLYPRLDDAEERALYAAEFESFMSGRAGDQGGWSQPERHIAANAPTLARRMKYLEPVLPRAGRVLEVGCSSGFMLYPLAQAGHQCVGIEPSGVFREYVQSRALPCFDSLDALRKEPWCRGGFDVVMHYFVLEHVADPVAVLRAQLELVKPGGVLVFEVPNAADALVTVYDVPAFERFYWSLAHHWYFNEASLEYVLKCVGAPFEIKLDQRYDLSNHIVWARDGRPGGMGRFTATLGKEIEDAYREALVRSRRCDTLIAILRKG